MKKILFIQFLKTQEQQNRILQLLTAKQKSEFKIHFAQFKDLIIDFNFEVFYKENKITDYDFVFFGVIQKNAPLFDVILNIVQKKGIPHLRYGGSSWKNNKLAHQYVLLQNGLPIIPTIFIRSANIITKDFLKKFGLNFPIILKPIEGSQGNNVTKNNSIEEINSNLLKIKESKKIVMLENLITNDGDFRVFIFKNRILGIIKRESTNKNEFRANVSLGGTAKQTDLPKEVKNICLEATKVLNLDFAGIDIIFDKNSQKYLIMEVNDAPQFKGLMSAIPGLNVYAEILKEIEAN